MTGEDATCEARLDHGVGVVDSDYCGPQDEIKIQLMNVTARRGGKTLEYRTAEIYHMSDGKITARWAFSDDTAAILEFFS